MESDNETKGSGNSYTTEFRQYDPRIGRWLSLDPLKHLLTDQSPYGLALNSPIFVIDVDGQFPIFINGRAGKISKASTHYWGKLPEIFSKYTNYKMGKSKSGPKNSQWSGDFLFVDGDKGNFFRFDEGVAQAKLDADDIWKKMKETMKDGKITEQIQMISHSRGVAFSEGYIEQITIEIQKRAEEESLTFNYDKNSIVEYNIGLAPHQSNAIHCYNNNVKSVYVSHYMDMLSGDDATGSVINIASDAPPGKDGIYDSHQIQSFEREFEFIINVMENAGENYEDRLKSWYKLYDKNIDKWSSEFTTGEENCEPEGQEFKNH
jgi:RHS repeat-associated protein